MYAYRRLQRRWCGIGHKNVLRCLLKLCSESHEMTSVGRLFQMTGAVRRRRMNVVRNQSRDKRTNSSGDAAERV